jgi:hypothetical protein
MAKITKRAAADLMDQLHAMTAAQLLDLIKNGVELPNPNTDEGGTIRVTAPASIFAAAIKFLKDNNITAEVDTARMKDLQDGVELPDFGDDEDLPSYAN